MTARSEFGKALRSLPWYLVGSYLITPLIAAFFTWGLGLALYAAPFAMWSKLFPAPDPTLPPLPAGYAFDVPDRGLNFMIGISPFLPGMLLWIFRQFFRAALFTFASNRRAY